MIEKNKYITNNIFEPLIPKGMISPKQALMKLCEYTYLYGERSNGKTTNCLGYLLGEFIMSEYERQFAIIRRYDDEILASNCQELFKTIIAFDYINVMTKGTFNGVFYNSKKFYLTKFDDTGRRINTCKKPFAHIFSISSQQSYKSTAYPDLHSALFDEVASKTYLRNEFVEFVNLLSTLVRLDDDFKIIMCSNTINRYCPYYREMGMYNISKQKQGTIDIYLYGEGKEQGSISAYYCEEMPKKLKKSNKFFSFNNPKLAMITSGKWEIGLYPHLPYKYNNSEIKFIYYIIFDSSIYQCNIIYSKEYRVMFTYIHCKTTPIKNKKTIIFSKEDNNPSLYNRKHITKPIDKIGEKILWFFKNDKVYYQDNFVGDSIMNYLKECSL